MTKVLVIHGAGMDTRGSVQTEIFGTMKLDEYDEHIRRYASELDIDVEIFHSNIEGEVINKLMEAHEDGTNAALINPAGYTTDHPALVNAIAEVRFPTVEVHVTNPARRGRVSEVAGASHAVVTGFGVFGYYLALRGLKEIM